MESIHVVIESVILNIGKIIVLLLVQRVSDQYLILSILKGDWVCGPTIGYS